MEEVIFFFYEEEEPSKSEIENEHEDDDNDEEHQHQATLTLTLTLTTNKYYGKTPWRTSEHNYDNELQTPKKRRGRAREQKKGGNPNRNPNGRGLT